MVKDSLGIFLIRIRPPKLKSGLAVFFCVSGRVDFRGGDGARGIVHRVA